MESLVSSIVVDSCFLLASGGTRPHDAKIEMRKDVECEYALAFKKIISYRKIS